MLELLPVFGGYEFAFSTQEAQDVRHSECCGASGALPTPKETPLNQCLNPFAVHDGFAVAVFIYL